MENLGREIKNNDIWKHFKGNIIRIVEASAFNTETTEECVVYKELYQNKIWVRPKAMFLEEVDHIKYPNVEQQYRFVKISEAKSNRKE